MRSRMSAGRRRRTTTIPPTSTASSRSTFFIRPSAWPNEILAASDESCNRPDYLVFCGVLPYSRHQPSAPPVLRRNPKNRARAILTLIDIAIIMRPWLLKRRS
jgi:hypothetical protein